MKCKYCKEEISLKVYGLPADVCWDCAPKLVKVGLFNEIITKVKRDG